MKRQLIFMSASLIIVAAALDGCGGNSSNSPPATGGGPTQPPQATSLTAFVHTQIAQTSDSTQPADVNGVTFSFPDDDNPAAFNDVVGSP